MLNELNNVIDYIEEHLTDDLSMDMIAENTGVSGYHCGKYFIIFRVDP